MKILDFDPQNKSNWGDLQVDVSKTLVQALKTLPNGFLIVFVRRDTEEAKKVLAIMDKPTNSQRGYYWSVVIPTIQEHFKKEGNFIKQDELHEAIKDCLAEEEGLTTEKMNPITGEVYQTRITISNAGNKKDTAKYIDAVVRWAANYGIYIPEPQN